jgi:hypothetical protein
MVLLLVWVVMAADGQAAAAMPNRVDQQFHWVRVFLSETTVILQAVVAAVLQFV